MVILGVSGYYHDSAAALLVDGEVKAAAQEERFTRIKHDLSFPQNSIKFCLEKAAITPAQLDAVVFFEKPLRKLERVFHSIFREAPFSCSLFLEASYNWLKEKLWIREKLMEFLSGVSREKIFFIPHHLSHAASTFFCSPFEEAAILTVDGVGEWATASISVGKGDDIKVLRELYFPNSLGLLYSTFTNFLGFQVNEENKVMGLAAYGQPRFLEEIRTIAHLHDDGSLSLDLSYFSFLRSKKRLYSSRFLELFGEPRSFGKPWLLHGDRLASEDQIYADLAASIQKFTEEAMLKMAVEAYRLTNTTNLCLAGGVAFNCVANSHLFKKSPFKKIYIQPAAGDAGGALGAALYFARRQGEGKFVLKHAFLGEAYGEEDIEKAVSGYDFKRLHPEKLLRKVASDIVLGKVVGWFQGRFEWGPRALGHRSLLARPDSLKLKDFLNREVKEREPFRPFAPSVLAEEAPNFFELNKTQDSFPLRFMLMTLSCYKPEHFKGALQIDKTARLQIVETRDSPLYYALIKEVASLVGIPAVLNTSLNKRGEPIVNHPSQALNFFRQRPLDVLVLNNYYLSK
jgi:carbamoyltransferase